MQSGMQVTMLSPGFIYEPYKPRDPIPFWRRFVAGFKKILDSPVCLLRNEVAIHSFFFEVQKG